jgi:hypothetical protein
MPDVISPVSLNDRDTAWETCHFMLLSLCKHHCAITQTKTATSPLCVRDCHGTCSPLLTETMLSCAQLYFSKLLTCGYQSGHAHTATGCLEKHGSIWISVTGAGPGISEDTAQRLTCVAHMPCVCPAKPWSQASQLKRATARWFKTAHIPWTNASGANLSHPQSQRSETTVINSIFLSVYCSFIAVLGGDTLWLFQKFLQCIKNTILEFTPSTTGLESFLHLHTCVHIFQAIIFNDLIFLDKFKWNFFNKDLPLQ